MSKEMLINTAEGQECRIAIISSGVLEELYIERQSKASKVGNIYKGRITNVEPSIQAAFIDFGSEKNGFLHISDVHPKHFPKGQKSAEAVGRKHGHRDRPPIQECLKRGEEVVVQLTKEGIGAKGPTLTTYLSIPGRMLVMMPGMTRLGVSRKIEDEEARDEVRKILSTMKIPEDMGIIVRTAGVGRNKRDLQRDLNYLLRLWKLIADRIKSVKAPNEIYKESDLVIRTIRDVYDSDIERIVCDNPNVARRVNEFLHMAMPRTKHTIDLYVGTEGLFHDYGLENEMENIFSSRVELKCGGSIVIDQTEALVAVDVNSGRFKVHNDAEKTALNVNIEAATEIARQLRLRDLGGVIVIDFIDLRDERGRRAVEKALRIAMKGDRAKTKVLRMSQLGLIAMTRQRVRPALKTTICAVCKNCSGAGLIKSDETLALSVMRELQRAVCHEDIVHIEADVTPMVAEYINNVQRQNISKLESKYEKTIVIHADSTLIGNEINIKCKNKRNSLVALDAAPAKERRKQIETVSFDAAANPETLQATMATTAVTAPTSETPEDAPPAKAKRKRSRRGGKRHRRSGEKQATEETQKSLARLMQKFIDGQREPVLLKWSE